MRGLVVGALLSIGLATSAQAAIFITPNGSADGLTNVTFDNNDPSAGTIFGDLTGGNDNSVRFTSTSDILVPEASGQARVSAQTGQINDLTFSVLGSLGFESVQLNVRSDNAFTITAFDQFGMSATQTVNNPSNGENRFRFDTDATQFITRIVVSSASGVADVRQVRIGALVPVPGPIAGAGLPVLMALGGFVWARRRKAAATA
jgi:hypothetical protein